MAHDYDWLVIGSGFGGSVSALRLREKGYSVGVLECGRRFGDDDFPRSTWDVRRYFWAPQLGMRGIFRLSTFKDVAIVSGSGSRRPSTARASRSRSRSRRSGTARSRPGPDARHPRESPHANPEPDAPVTFGSRIPGGASGS